MAVCGQLGLGLKSAPPRTVPLEPGSLVAGLPLDPLLAATYARLGHAAFATEAGGLVLTRLDDRENTLEERNRQWQADEGESFPLALFLFGGEAGLAHHYATVPKLADEQGRQPVVFVDTYEVPPHVLPVASDVDRFFELYSRYLEALVAHPAFSRDDPAVLAFPRQLVHLVATDERLSGLIHAGAFDPLMPSAEAQEWAHRVVSGARQ